MITEQKFYMQRRLKFTMLTIASQMLLIALAITWLLQLGMIATSRSIYFIENNHTILYTEIFATLLIIVYAVYIVINQIRRLGERRGTDRRTSDRVR